jgi:hypothetical protein
MMNANSKMNKRSFVAITAALAFLGLAPTGYMNHVLQFSPMTQQHHAWMAAHNGLAVLFIFFGVWHIILNKRALLAYIKGAASRIPALNREMLTALAVVFFVLLIAVGHTFIVR